MDKPSRLGRDLYRSIKNMSNEEMSAFLDRQAMIAVENYKKEHGLSIQTDEKGKYIGMSRDLFKIIHSELIQQVQTIEHNLKVIYADVQLGNFSDNYESILLLLFVCFFRDFLSSFLYKFNLNIFINKIILSYFFVAVYLS